MARAVCSANVHRRQKQVALVSINGDTYPTKQKHKYLDRASPRDVPVPRLALPLHEDRLGRSCEEHRTKVGLLLVIFRVRDLDAICQTALHLPLLLLLIREASQAERLELCVLLEELLPSHLVKLLVAPILLKPVGQDLDRSHKVDSELLSTLAYLALVPASLVECGSSEWASG